MKARRAARVVVGALACALLAIAVFVAAHWSRALDVWYWLRTGYDFEWMPEGMHALGNHCINEAGQVGGRLDGQPAIWSVTDPGVQLLRTLPRFRSCSSLSAINERGNAIGLDRGCEQSIRFGDPNAFYWSAGSGMVEIKMEGGYHLEAVEAINKHDQVVGTARKDRRAGFTWNPESGFRLLEAPVEDGDFRAFDINDQGWIVGSAFSGHVIHPILWKPGEPVQVLGLPSGILTGIGAQVNERGQILVTQERPGGIGKPSRPPYIWSEGKGYVVVPLPKDCDEIAALSLNDLGHVLLEGTRSGTKEHVSFLVVDGELKLLPPSRLGRNTTYVQVTNKGWLAGYVLPEGTTNSLENIRSFLARP